MSETNQCSAVRCNQKSKVLGFCLQHYQRHYLGRDVDAPMRANRKNGATLERNQRGEKFCIYCEYWLPENCFASHGATLDRKQICCLECTSSRELVRKYGISKKQMLEILTEQNGCAICHTTEPTGRNTWHIDHDHDCCPGIKTCGKCIRGVLCSFCNKALGQFKDSITNLENAISYLESYRRDT